MSSGDFAVSITVDGTVKKQVQRVEMRAVESRGFPFELQAMLDECHEWLRDQPAMVFVG